MQGGYVPAGATLSVLLVPSATVVTAGMSRTKLSSLFLSVPLDTTCTDVAATVLERLDNLSNIKA